MTKQMQAAVVEQFGQGLVLKEVDIPTPGPGQILVKTEACGVCHTDLHAEAGDWPVKPSLPFIPGHEGIGIVVALGEGVTAVKEGDYLRIECTSKIMRFVDDLELKISDDRLIVRSESRIGYSDFGVNRKRTKQLRAELSDAGLIK